MKARSGIWRGFDAIVRAATSPMARGASFLDSSTAGLQGTPAFAADLAYRRCPAPRSVAVTATTMMTATSGPTGSLLWGRRGGGVVSVISFVILYKMRVFRLWPYSVFERSMSSGLTRGSTPVRVKKTRQIRNLDSFTIPVKG
jgi:hypothetical protein